MTKDHLMGVINITPNSFSDGNQFNQIKTFEERLSELASNCKIVDLGAESTAPANTSIGAIEEWKRFESIVLPHSDLMCKFQDKFQLEFSFDSYRIETIQKLLSFFVREKRLAGFIWNDVSGHYRDAILLLKKYPGLHYIVCHNSVPSRDLTGQHHQFQASIKRPILERVKEFFSEAYQLFLSHQLNSKISFDCCFGFAKTREENWELWQHLPELILTFPKEINWVVGISRKSFLREGPLSSEKNHREKELLALDQKQYQLLLELKKKVPENRLIFRVHRTPQECAAI